MCMIGGPGQAFDLNGGLFTTRACVPDRVAVTAIATDQGSEGSMCAFVTRVVNIVKIFGIDIMVIWRVLTTSSLFKDIKIKKTWFEKKRCGLLIV